MKTFKTTNCISSEHVMSVSEFKQGISLFLKPIVVGFLKWHNALLESINSYWNVSLLTHLLY